MGRQCAARHPPCAGSHHQAIVSPSPAPAAAARLICSGGRATRGYLARSTCWPTRRCASAVRICPGDQLNPSNFRKRQHARHWQPGRHGERRRARAAATSSPPARSGPVAWCSAHGLEGVPQAHCCISSWPWAQLRRDESHSRGQPTGEPEKSQSACFTALYLQTSTHHRSRSTSRVPPSDTAHRKSRPAACRVQLTRRASSFLQASSLPARTVICGTMQPLNPNMPFASQGRVQQPSGRPCPCRLITFLPYHQCPDPALSPRPNSCEMSRAAACPRPPPHFSLRPSKLLSPLQIP